MATVTVTTMRAKQFWYDTCHGLDSVFRDSFVFSFFIKVDSGGNTSESLGGAV